MDGIAADAVCTVIGLCLGEEQPKTFTFNKNPDLDDCSVCEDVMEFVKELMGENFTEVCCRWLLIYCVLQVNTIFVIFYF